MKDLAREKRIYLAIWRKAFKEQVPSLTLKVPTYNTALSVRMAMYRTIQPYRDGSIHDVELNQAAEFYVLRAQKEPPAVIVLPRVTAEAAELMFADLGLDETDLMLEDEIEMLNSVQKAVAPPEAPTGNPFFKRED